MAYLTFCCVDTSLSTYEYRKALVRHEPSTAATSLPTLCRAIVKTAGYYWTELGQELKDDD
jgi:hypothetical protein